MRTLVCVKQVKTLGDEVEFTADGTDVDPDYVRRQLTRDDGQPGVVLITPVEGKAMAIVARRTESPT